MRTRRLLAAVVGSAMALTLAGAAFAVDFADGPQGGQLPLAAADATQGTAEECAADPVQPGPGETVWHFVHNQADGDSGTLTATFTDTGDTTTPNGEPQEANVLHYWVTTSAGDTLESASDDVTGGNLIVSHVCTAEAPPTDTLPPTSTIDQTPASPTGTNVGLILGAILLVAGGLTVFAMRPRRSTR